MYRQVATDLLLRTFGIHVPFTGRSVGEFEQYLMCVLGTKQSV